MTLPEIVDKIALKIRAHPSIHAMWLEGSYATGKANEQSDIDVWLDIDDGMFVDVVHAFRQALSEIAEIDHETSRGLYSDDPKLMKQTFILKDFPFGQEIELDLQEHSRKFIFSKTEHYIRVLFDKDGTITWK